MVARFWIHYIDIRWYGYGYGHGYGYGYGYGKRRMKKIASRKRANNVHTEVKDNARIEHLKEKLDEVERNKAQLKATHGCSCT